jgi:hypothetical protein
MDATNTSAANAAAEFNAELIELADPLPPIIRLPGVQPSHFPQSSNPAAAFLANHCVRVNKSDAKIKLDGVWKQQPLNAARATLLQYFGGERTEFCFTEKDIRRFTETDIRYLYGEGLFPGCPEFVTFEKLEYINNWDDTRLVPVPQWLPRCEMILRIIRENLCDLPPVPFPAMLTEIQSPDENLFRYVMHWLAALYQRPGYHIGTVLWFCGERTGIGKGTLLKIMRRLLGAQYVGKLNADEMRAGFSGSFAGKLLMEGDEFDIGSRKDLSDRFKVWVSNPLLNIHKKQPSPLMCRIS